MLPRYRLILAALSLTMLLTLFAGAASASRLSVSETAFRVDWITRAEFPEETQLELIASNGTTVRCDVRMTGRLEGRVITKTAGSTIGRIEGAEARNCAGGTATFLTETMATTPWRVLYDSFTGALPNITGIKVRLINVAIQVTSGVITCLALTEAGMPGVGIFNVQNTTPRTIRSLNADETAAIRLRGGFLEACAAFNGRLRGQALVWSGAGPLITVTLI